MSADFDFETKAIRLETSLPNKEDNTATYDYMLYRYCSNCGAFFYALWSYPAIKKQDSFSATAPYTGDEKMIGQIKREQRKMTSAPCPVCNASAKMSGFYSDNTNPNRLYHKDFCDIVDDKFFRRAQFRANESNAIGDDRTNARKRVDAMIQECGNASLLQVQNESGEQIGSSPEKLKEYLSHLIRLELNAYSLPKALEDLCYEKIQVTRKCNYEAGMRTKKFRDAVVAAKANLESAKQNDVKVEYPPAPQEPQLKTPGFFNKSKVLAENKALQEQYNIAMEQYNRAREACHVEEQRLKERAIREATEELQRAEESLATMQLKTQGKQTPSTALGIALDERIHEVENCLQETLKARDEMYAFGVVFGKYRDLVSVSSFYEYLMAGRCTALEGADGAYNLYEREIRADLIISQLTEIISKLDQIQANQYTLYAELRKANTQLASLNSKMNAAIETLDRIGNNTAQIAYNTEVTAYCSKKNAELTDALGYMVALKQR